MKRYIRSSSAPKYYTAVATVSDGKDTWDVTIYSRYTSVEEAEDDIRRFKDKCTGIKVLDTDIYESGNSINWEESDYSLFIDGERVTYKKYYTNRYGNSPMMILPKYDNSTGEVSWCLYIVNESGRSELIDCYISYKDAMDAGEAYYNADSITSSNYISCSDTLDFTKFSQEELKDYIGKLIDDALADSGSVDSKTIRDKVYEKAKSKKGETPVEQPKPRKSTNPANGIPYDLVSTLVILRDWVDVDDAYINDEHKRLVGIADAIYNADIDSSMLKPESKKLYDKYGKRYFDKVIRDAEAIDSQINPNNVNDLIEEYNSKVSEF